MNRDAITKKQNALFFPAFVVFIIVNILAFVSDFAFKNGEYKIINAISIVQLITNVLFVYICSKKMSIGILFIVFSFVFHQSHLAIIASEKKTWMLFDTYNRFSYETAYAASSFVLKANAALSIGIVLGIFISSKKKNINENRCVVNDYTDEEISFVSGLLCVVGFIFNLYKFILVFRTARRYGYLATFETGLNGIVLTFSSFFILCFCVWLQYTKVKRRTINAICILIIIYEVFYMSTGNRYDPIIAIICIAVFYKERFIRKIAPWMMVVIIALVYFVLSIMVAISASRKNTSDIDLFDIKNFGDAENLSFSVAGEFGEAIYNVAQGVEYFPKEFSLVQVSKISYVALHIVPGLASVVPSANNVLYYINNFPNHYAMGGSYIGEMYFFGGSFGFVLAVPLGILMGYTMCKTTGKKKNYVFLKVSLYLAFLSILRGYMFNTIRVLVWLWIISYCMLNTTIKNYRIRVKK